MYVCTRYNIYACMYVSRYYNIITVLLLLFVVFAIILFFIFFLLSLDLFVDCELVYQTRMLEARLFSSASLIMTDPHFCCECMCLDFLSIRELNYTIIANVKK